MTSKLLPYSIPVSSKIVIGYSELVEKIRLKTNGLDDRAVEIIKYYLLEKALISADSESEIRIVFKRMESCSLVFNIEGLKTGNVGVSKISTDIYNKTVVNLENTINQEPFNTLLAPPYISLNKIYMEGYV